MSKNSDLVWTTARARMNAERRMLCYDAAAQFSITIFSITLLITSIYSKEIESTFTSFGKINVVSSAMVLFLTLFVYGFGFRDRAAKYRECYLKLQSLLVSGSSEQEIGIQYFKILDVYQNHAVRDYDDLIVDHHVRRNFPINIPGSNEKILASKLMVTSYYTRSIIFYAVCWVVPSLVLVYTIYFLMKV